MIVSANLETELVAGVGVVSIMSATLTVESSVFELPAKLNGATANASVASNVDSSAYRSTGGGTMEIIVVVSLVSASKTHASNIASSSIISAGPMGGGAVLTFSSVPPIAPVGGSMSAVVFSTANSHFRTAFILSRLETVRFSEITMCDGVELSPVFTQVCRLIYGE